MNTYILTTLAGIKICVGSFDKCFTMFINTKGGKKLWEVNQSNKNHKAKLIRVSYY